MALFQLKWLRRFVRRNTNPMSYDYADIWKRRLSFGYAFLAWNAFGFVLYAIYSGKADWAKAAGLKSDVELAMTPAQSFAQQFKVEKAKVIRFKGLADYTTYEIDNTKEEAEAEK